MALSVLEKAQASRGGLAPPFTWPEEPKTTDWQPSEMSPLIKFYLEEIKEARRKGEKKRGIREVNLLRLVLQPSLSHATHLHGGPESCLANSTVSDHAFLKSIKYPFPFSMQISIEKFQVRTSEVARYVQLQHSETPRTEDSILKQVLMIR